MGSAGSLLASSRRDLAVPCKHVGRDAQRTRFFSSHYLLTTVKWGGTTIVQPPKKPRGGDLTPPEQAANRQISSIRMRIEHAIGGVKRYRIVKDIIRLLKDGIRDAVVETCGGWHNFRLLYRAWNYAH